MTRKWNYREKSQSEAVELSVSPFWLFTLDLAVNISGLLDKNPI